MPAGIPVACVAIGKAGARNAGYLAAQILAQNDDRIAGALRDDRSENARLVQEKNNTLKELNAKSS
jgi:5-(carboxyamino)imidazole ribonucleotide mutase